MVRRWRRELVVVRMLFCALIAMFAGAAQAAPHRIVSLDYCADQYVLALADRSQIAALSRGARRDDSYFRDRARGIPQVRASLEEVLALHPDLVVRNWGGPWDAERVYGRFNVPVLHVGDAADFAAARADVLNAARMLGRAQRGDAIVRDFDERLRRLRAQAPETPPPVMYLSSGGAVAGSGVLMDDVIRAAGGRNIWQGRSWNVLPLERMVETPPALVALAFFDTGRTRLNAWSPSRNPVLLRALARTRTVKLSAAAVSCESWYALDAAEQIAAALRRP
ncbi:MAG TPA: ABC transporter substrate-binding protein [Caulobacterales bacterium]|nr:ABC transporter substrate-binding protein [Caulobacterales bacterium]